MSSMIAVYILSSLCGAGSSAASLGASASSVSRLSSSVGACRKERRGIDCIAAAAVENAGDEALDGRSGEIDQTIHTVTTTTDYSRLDSRFIHTTTSHPQDRYRAHCVMLSVLWLSTVATPDDATLSPSFTVLHTHTLLIARDKSNWDRKLYRSKAGLF